MAAPYADQFTFRDVPFVGPWPAKFGRVLDMWTSPCEVTPEIAVQAFWVNIPMLVWTLVKPTPEDYLTTRMGYKHKRRPKFRVPVRDVSLPDPIPNSGLGWASFRGIQFAERVGWNFLVVDATLDFVINWTSTAYQWQGCPVAGTPFASAIMLDGIYGYGPGTDIPLVHWGVDHEHIYEVTPSGIACYPPWVASCGVGIQCKPIPGLPFAGLSNVRLVQSGTGGNSMPVSEQHHADGSITYQTVYRNFDSIGFTGGFTCYVDVLADGWQNLGGSTMRATGGTSLGIGPDP